MLSTLISLLTNTKTLWSQRTFFLAQEFPYQLLPVSINKLFHLSIIMELFPRLLHLSCSIIFLTKKILTYIRCKLPTVLFIPLFHSLKIVKLQDIFHLSVLTFANRTMNKISLVHFHSYFTQGSSASSYQG